jgi:hypothetical protein
MIVSHRLMSAARSLGVPIAYVVGVGVVMGAVFVGAGMLEGWLSWAEHAAWELFAAGFACGVIAATAAWVSDTGCGADSPASPPSGSPDQRGR